MTESDQIAEALRLQAKGQGQHAIARAIGKPRHLARQERTYITTIGSALSVHETAYFALAEAVRVDEVKAVIDVSAAIRAYGRQSKKLNRLRKRLHREIVQRLGGAS